MRYVGGKSRLKNTIAGYLNSIHEPGMGYWEPFVGGGWVLEAMCKALPANTLKIASDAHPWLIAMWQHAQKGWVPPAPITREMYWNAHRCLRNIEKWGTDPAQVPPTIAAYIGFVGFPCSFSGKWFGGYAAPDEKQDYSIDGQREIVHKSYWFRQANVHFHHFDFFQVYPGIIDHPHLIYCDPPYAGVTSYSGVPTWDAEKFWQQVRVLEGHGHTVVISEYDAPIDFTCILEVEQPQKLHADGGERGTRTEKLFRYGKARQIQPRLF